MALKILVLQMTLGYTWNKEVFKMSEIAAIEPIGALIPVNNYVVHKTVPLQNATGTEEITITEAINSDGRTMTTSEVALTIYDRFGNLQTIPPQSRGQLF